MNSLVISVLLLEYFFRFFSELIRRFFHVSFTPRKKPVWTCYNCFSSQQVFQSQSQNRFKLVDCFSKVKVKITWLIHDCHVDCQGQGQNWAQCHCGGSVLIMPLYYSFCTPSIHEICSNSSGYFLSWYFSADVYFCMVLIIYIQKENSHLLTLRLGMLLLLEYNSDLVTPLTYQVNTGFCENT